MDTIDTFLKTYYFQGPIFDLVPDAILFLEKKHLKFPSKTNFKKF